VVELEPGERQLAAVEEACSVNPQIITILRTPARPGVEHDVLRLATAGAGVIHLSADVFGRGEDGAALPQCLENSHRLLVEAGVRDQVTLLASGGIAAAEHLPKTIILGADGVFVDAPLLVAMECRVCGECQKGRPCPARVGEVDASWGRQADHAGTRFYKWGATRVINLILAWRDQLLEVLGAMGIRDVRRLRGERGRAIFADEMRGDFRQRLGDSGDPGSPESGASAGSTQEFANRDQVERPARPGRAPRRFPVLPGDWLVIVDRERCVDCGICADSCRYGVHRRLDGKTALAEPINGKCIGPVCEEQNEWCCVTVCPWTAIRLEPSPLDQVLGDLRWPAALLKETYRQARTGEGCEDAEREWIGASGGGFDRLRLRVLGDPPGVQPEEVDLSIPLNRRRDCPQDVTIPVPWYGGGMSYGSISLAVMLGRAAAAQELGTFTSTGEGGYPEELVPYQDHVITQIATGLFGVSETTIQRSRLVEFKYAQGAKPGLGGHLLGEKNTAEVALMREAVPGTALFSPFPFHSVYSVEDHKKHLDWVRSIHPEVLISVKVSTPSDVDMVGVGSFYAGSNSLNLDGAYGGTGAAPDIAKKNIAMPLEYAIVQVHDFLVSEGIRDEVVLVAGGGIRSADDVVKAIALGADGCAIGTAELVAIDCVRCGNCERGRGCPIGIATTDSELASQLEQEWVCQRIVNMYTAWAAQIRRRLAGFDLASVRALVGRRDLLKYVARSPE
jgi:glutamate synthase domain-containing protein 2